MPMSPNFKTRLGREVRLYIREARDGCMECRACRGTCSEHHKEFADLILHPRKYLHLDIPPAMVNSEPDTGGEG